jgi:hypothetical protein
MELLFRTLPSYTSMPNAAVGNTILYNEPTNVQLFYKLSYCYMFRHYRVILRQLVINTLPSYTSMSNAAVGNTILYKEPTTAQLFHKLSHYYIFRHYRIILRQLVINTLPSYTSISNAAVGNTILYNEPTTAQLFHKLSHYYIFRHYRVILRQLVINTLPSYTSISNAAVGNTILYNDQQMYNYFTNYHTPPTCFDTTVSSSWSSYFVPCHVTQVCQIQPFVIQFTIKMFHISSMLFKYQCLISLKYLNWSIYNKLD